MGLLRFAALTSAAACLLSQEPAETFRVDVRLVRMLVTVKNARGDAIGTLARGDFTVTDNGVPQELAVFERESAQPLSVALLYDTSLSTISDSRYKKNSVHKFVRALFSEGNPGDALSLFSFNDEVIQRTQFIRNAGRLEGAVNGLPAHGGTALYDAAFLAARELERRNGRRVMIVISDGGDTASRADFQQALEALHRANAVLYSIVVVPIAADAGRNLRGENALITLSSWTGGKAFFPTPGEALDQTFQDILRDLRTQYQLGYYPKNVPTSKERFHRVQVEVKRPDVVVYARNGYYEETERPEGARRSRARP
ncbi:MAG: VWA domain-containing protein [Bryobacterales bacterium]|nr:VWA domain-containing protein [Bryobacterales bacterium]